MEVGQVRRIDIQSEMRQSYLDYAMSVIVSRALPDARDGLKPVHRRILHAMDTMGIRPDSPFRKSARIVGEVLGKYHPHGDMAVYDAMARLAQDFSMRYPLVEGQGNFGSVDGDPPAAMRYTEARLATLAMDILADIDQDTVDFVDNFDGSLQEPEVLPAALPNLLINGATGIAVGMSTSIPPHNLGEVVDALVYMLENWSRLDRISLDDLMKFVQGPDFPTGGIILRDKKEGEGLVTAYATGRGKTTVQARAHIEAMGRGRSRIIVTELPYQTNKSNLIERIADLVRDGALEGITDLRDESDREGMRIVIELAKSADAEKVLGDLYRRTTMRGTFSMIMLALVDGQPRLLGLKQALSVYLEHRIEVVRRRSTHQLERAKKRAHILDGLRLALAQLDNIIDTIRNSKDTDQASQRLQRKFEFSQEQAQAILDMPLRRLAALERRKIDQEHKDTLKRIKALETILASDKKLYGVIADELKSMKDLYSDRRRTVIVEPDDAGRKKGALTASDLAPSKDTWLVLSQDNRLSRTTTARLPRLSGRASPRLVIGANVRDNLFLFTKQGQAACMMVHTIPETDEPDQGTPLSGLSGLDPGTEVVTGIAIPEVTLEVDSNAGFLVFATRQGMVKKSGLDSFPGASARAFEAVKINEGDELSWVDMSNGQDEVLLISNQGMAIRFPETEIRPMGLSAAGVLGMRLEESARLVGMHIVRPGTQLLLLADDGRAKRTKVDQFPKQGRYGKGVLAWASTDQAEIVGTMLGQATDRGTAVLAGRADRSVRLGDVARRGRTSAGKALFEVPEEDKVVALKQALPRGALNEPPPTKSRPKRKGSGKGSGSTKKSKKRSGTQSASGKKGSKSSKRKG